MVKSFREWRRRRSSSQSRSRPRLEKSAYRSYLAVHPFDLRNGVETSGLIYDLPTGSEHDSSNNGYFAVAPSIFRQIVERLELNYPRFRFVDLGSGKGRAILLASEYPFREVIGVELSPHLVRIARQNISNYGQRDVQIQAVQADAAEFPWPSGPLVLYMWNAFAAPVMEKVLRNLERACDEQPRPIYLIYVHPELQEMVDNCSFLDRLWCDEFTMDEEDYSAWAFPERTEICAVYRTLK